MDDYVFSRHAKEMKQQRGIKDPWVDLTLKNPDIKVSGIDGTVRYIRAINERDGRYLCVVINPCVMPPRIVTVFFDRRLGRKK